MPDPKRKASTGYESGAPANHDSPPGMPGWVKVFGAVAVILLLLFGVLHLTGNSLGGPGLHGSAPGAESSLGAPGND